MSDCLRRIGDAEPLGTLQIGLGLRVPPEKAIDRSAADIGFGEHRIQADGVAVRAERALGPVFLAAASACGRRERREQISRVNTLQVTARKLAFAQLRACIFLSSHLEVEAGLRSR
jgi:hypothetical protein